MSSQSVKNRLSSIRDKRSQPSAILITWSKKIDGCGRSFLIDKRLVFIINASTSIYLLVQLSLPYVSVQRESLIVLHICGLTICPISVERWRISSWCRNGQGNTATPSWFTHLWVSKTKLSLIVSFNPRAIVLHSHQTNSPEPLLCSQPTQLLSQGGEAKPTWQKTWLNEQQPSSMWNVIGQISSRNLMMSFV